MARTRPPAGVAGAAARLPGAVDREHVGHVVVDDDVARDLVAEGAALVAPQLAALDELDVVGAAVVFDGLALALDVFFAAIALLAEEGALAGSAVTTPYW
jgi:hypothetical protein